MKQSGFTLIETLVAIFLLTVGVAGSFSLMQKTTSFASISSSQLTAAYLAQEGIEIIRNIRDSNYLASTTWDANINAGADFKLNYNSAEFPDAVCGNYLKHNGAAYVCSDDGKFQRQITIDKSVPNKMAVSVLVSWSERGNSHQVVAQTELYKWR